MGTAAANVGPKHCDGDHRNEGTEGSKSTRFSPKPTERLQRPLNSRVQQQPKQLCLEAPAGNCKTAPSSASRLRPPHLRTHMFHLKVVGSLRSLASPVRQCFYWLGAGQIGFRWPPSRSSRRSSFAFCTRPGRRQGPPTQEQT